MLRAGQHPVTRKRLPVTTWADGRSLCNCWGYARKQSEEVVDERFVRYEPETFPVAMPRQGAKTVDENQRLRMAKIRCRELNAARKSRKLRKKACEVEVADLIATFGQDEPRLNDGVGLRQSAKHC